MKKENFIKRIRKELTLTQQELADKLNVSRSHVSMAESGRRILPKRALATLTDLLKSDYFSEDDTPNDFKEVEKSRLKTFLYTDLIKQRKRVEENEEKLKKLDEQYKRYKKAFLIIHQTELGEESEEKLKQIKKKLKTCDSAARAKKELLIAQLKTRVKLLEHRMKEV